MKKLVTLTIFTLLLLASCTNITGAYTAVQKSSLSNVALIVVGPEGPAQNTQVAIVGKGQKRTTTTNDKGLAYITAIPIGSYLVYVDGKREKALYLPPKLTGEGRAVIVKLREQPA